MLLKGEGFHLSCRPRFWSETTRRSVGLSLDVPLEAPGVLRAAWRRAGSFKLRWDEDAAGSIWGAASVGLTFMAEHADGAGLGITSF